MPDGLKKASKRSDSGFLWPKRIMVQREKAEIKALCDINEETLKIASEMSGVNNI